MEFKHLTCSLLLNRLDKFIEKHITPYQDNYLEIKGSKSRKPDKFELVIPSPIDPYVLSKDKYTSDKISQIIAIWLMKDDNTESLHIVDNFILNEIKEMTKKYFQDFTFMPNEWQLIVNKISSFRECLTYFLRGDVKVIPDAFSYYNHLKDLSQVPVIEIE